MEGRVVGCTMITPEWSDWRNGTFLWIQSVYVMPEYRKKGIFSTLYAHVKEMVLNSHDYLGLRLYVVNENLVAREAYSHCGMDGEHYRLYEWIK
jgi:predicted GNAT family acetyltransferase